MSVNILDLIKGAVSDQVMGQIGELLGTDAEKTPSLFETAAGSILGGLMKKGSTSQGAQDIFGAVQDQDDSVLDKLGDLLGGGETTEGFAKQGSGVLDMVLGGSEQTNGMIGMVAKALGLDEGIVGKLLMLAAPIVMNVIGKYIKEKGLDAVGLGSLLGEQKSYLAGVLPASLSNDLGFGDMLGQAGDAVGKAGDAARDAVGSAGRVAGDAANAAAGAGGGLMKYILPVGLIAVAALFFGPKIYDMVTQSGGAIDKDSITAEAVTNWAEPDFASIPGFDSLGEAGTKMADAMTNITSVLSGVSDDAGAQSVAGTITAFTGELDGFGIGDLEGTAKSAASGVIGKFIESLKALLAEKSEGIQGILKPVIDTLIEKLNTFTQ